MASAAYLALLDQPSVHWITLVEITARQALRSWTSAGSGAYSIAWAAFSHPATIRPDTGIYRDLVAVRENGVALSSRASLALVQANPGSYFHDASTGTIYIETSGSAHPDTLAIIDVQFVVRLATEPVAFASLPPYDAQVDGDRLPSMRMERMELLRGVSSFPSGDLTLTNGDGFWDYPASAWIGDQAAVAFLAGAAGMAYADFEPMMTMQAARALAARDAQAVLQLRSYSNALSKALPHAYESSAFYFGYLWGKVFDAPMFAFGLSTHVNLLAVLSVSQVLRHPTFGFRLNGLRVYERGSGALFETADHTICTGFSASDALVPFTAIPLTVAAMSGDCTGVEEHYEFRADMDRIDDDDGSGAAVMATCGAVARDLLLEAGVPAALIDDAAFDQADIDNPAVVGLHVQGGFNVPVDRLVLVQQLLDELQRSTLSSVHLGADGRFTIRVYDPSFAWLTMDRVTDIDLSKCEAVAEVNHHPVAAIRVHYAKQIGRDVFSATTASSAEAVVTLDKDETDVVETCLANEADAATLAARLLLVSRQSPLEIDIEIGAQLMTYSPGDKVRLQRARGASISGTFDQPMEIVSITKHLATMRVAARLSNMRGIGPLVKRAAPDGTPDWASASADERMAYAFATDANGFVVTGDGSTFRQAVAW